MSIDNMILILLLIIGLVAFFINWERILRKVE